MRAGDRARAAGVASAIASSLGMRVDDVDVLQDSNTLTLRLRPCDVVARIAHRGQEVAAFEVDLARRLVGCGSPVAPLHPKAPSQPFDRDGFVITLWTYCEPIGTEAAPAEVAAALVRLHAGMRTIDVPAPHFTDRVASALRLVESSDLTPTLGAADRALLVGTLGDLTRAVVERRPPEQLLHGEPHPGNALNTADGLRFVDLETCCRGPVELDLAHVPVPVAESYPGLDTNLLGELRGLVLAMVAAWRWDPADRLPDGRRAANDLLAALRAGPPYAALLDVMPPAG